MRSQIFARTGLAAIAVSLTLGVTSATAEPAHGIAMYGEPELPPDFVALPYANPDAPVGGRIVEANVGTFDSLNPYIRKGNVPWQIRFYIGETLMGRSLDEPFTLYGLLAESIETGPNREWVEFTLRPEAEFSDGSPVTVEDVIWSFETLGTEGNPRYASFWSAVESLEQTGERTVRFTFNTDNRELALLAGMRPILKKAQFEGLDFAEEGDSVVPIASSPYVIDDYEMGRFVSLRRNPDYWGWDVPFRAGSFNIEEYRLEFFGDETAAFEAFKAGEVTTTREFSGGRWQTQYDFPAIQSGEYVKEEIAHERPSGMTGFVMNTRNPLFQDWQVREALITVFNFEFINDAMTGGAQPRITSYFSNSPLSMDHGPAEGRVLELLEQYSDDLLPGAIEGYDLPVSDGSERNRAGTARALELFEEAGWTIEDGVMQNEEGEPFEFDILLEQGGSENSSIIDMYLQSLERVGIEASVTTVDDAQYTERTDLYDFDMTYFRRALSLSPGTEQYLYWGSEYVDEEAGRNLMGVSSPAVDGLVDTLLTATDSEDFYAAAKALDRVLTTGRYVIPIYQWNVSWLAHDAALKHPETIPIMGDTTNWLPDYWWYEED
ncbi:extracellular solute-binding protein [Pelagovum pacificum]|uniref:ABC transporter substrate-binding protein n=1 Tax=Pelagovum pacificum TaxID=2588711 RepID=A0A5C5GBI9_9RHOB|nr:extracellular solute-binding protein [Pelagovum pacificum]QQA44779.1 ABC transporter substrate-binding protein [Pelagovum pacificum]TNY32113.1 ABC transporter substrate-binding protein [Pelagovum pacificum]